MVGFLLLLLLLLVPMSLHHPLLLLPPNLWLFPWLNPWLMEILNEPFDLRIGKGVKGGLGVRVQLVVFELLGKSVV